MRYYLIAGERSGDLHAGNLVRSIKQFDSNAECRGFGGEFMKEAGVDVVVHYANMAVMGFAEVIRNLNKISGYLKKCKHDILEYKPDVIILIDYGGFNRRIASFARKKGMKVYYYISPKVWAWYQKRALELKANVDRMFVILPFEKDFFKKYNWDVDYVGNPVVDAVKAHKVNNNFLEQHNLSKNSPVIALLPGSRKQELANVIPVMAGVVKQFPEYQFVVARVSNLDEKFYNELADVPNVKFMYDETYDLLANANAAIVTSGTATLETALFKVPQVVVYKTSLLSYRIAKSLIRVPYISLVNLIADKEVVKELIQQKVTVENISAELQSLLSSPLKERIMKEYEHIIEVLDTGSASENAARLMVKYLKGEVQTA